MLVSCVLPLFELKTDKSDVGQSDSVVVKDYC